MSPETNKAIVRRMLGQVWNARRLDLIAEFYTDDVIQHLVGFPVSPGLAGVKEATANSLNAFPDLHLNIDDEIAAGDKVVSRWTMAGTHQGELLGIPATGKHVRQTGVTIYRLDNARIAELWFFPDSMGLMQQLGAIPPGAA